EAVPLRVELAGDEDVAAADAARPDAFADAGLVAVVLRCVDEAIAERDGLRGRLGCLLVVHGPCAQAEAGNLDAIGEGQLRSGLGIRHGASAPCSRRRTH